jgi:hypothetical protein
LIVRYQLLREHYNLSTWILLGCVIQSGLSFIFPRSYAAFPAILLFGWGIVDVLLMHFGLKHDVYSDGVIDGKWSVAYPGQTETEAVNGKPGDNGPGAVMILGVRSNSPMGFFADGKILAPISTPFSQAQHHGLPPVISN